MILRICNFEEDISISEEYVRVLEIEDKKLFANIANSIHSLYNNRESVEYILFLEGDKELSLAKDCFVIFDILSVDFNDRKILKKLYSKIKSLLYLDEETMEMLESLHNEVFNIIDSSMVELPFEFDFRAQLELEGLLKYFGIKLVNESQTIMDKMLSFIDLISYLELCRLLIFCNVKAYLTDSQLEEFYKHVVHNKQKVLLIEGSSSKFLLEYERKNRIDLHFDDYEVKY